MRHFAALTLGILVAIVTIGCSSDDARRVQLQDQVDSARAEAEKAKAEVEQFKKDAARAAADLKQAKVELERAKSEGAIQAARISATLLNRVRTLYATEVAARVGNEELVTHDYRRREGAIPLPDTLLIELGRSMATEQGEIQVRLYSDFPFPSTKDGGPRGDFERAALAQLREHPDEVFSRNDEVDGRRYLRYGTADRMQASCVECHNRHPHSPKKDWRVGDVAGVLEVMIPATR
jgi:hypothetical protein